MSEPKGLREIVSHNCVSARIACPVGVRQNFVSVPEGLESKDFEHNAADGSFSCFISSHLVAVLLLVLVVVVVLMLCSKTP